MLGVNAEMKSLLPLLIATYAIDSLPTGATYEPKREKVIGKSDIERLEKAKAKRERKRLKRVKQLEDGE